MPAKLGGHFCLFFVPILWRRCLVVPTIRYLSRKGVIMMFSLVVVGASPIGGIGISQRTSFGYLSPFNLANITAFMGG